MSEAQRAVCVFACVCASSVWNELISARNANPSKNDRQLKKLEQNYYIALLFSLLTVNMLHMSVISEEQIESKTEVCDFCFCFGFKLTGSIPRYYSGQK